MRAGDAERLVQHQGHARQGIDRSSLDRQAGLQLRRQGDAAIRAGQRRAVQPDGAHAGQGGDLLARAVAQVGQQLVEAGLDDLAHFLASNTLYGPPASRRSARANRGSSAPS